MDNRTLSCKWLSRFCNKLLQNLDSKSKVSRRKRSNFFLIYYQDMALIVNRILYSFYSLNQWIFKFLDWIFRPLIILYCKILYQWDPFNKIRSSNKNLEEFISNTYKMSDEASGNIDNGLSITNSQGDLIIIFIPYFICIFKLVIGNHLIIGTLNYFWISAIISFLLCYFFSFRNDRYKEYFKTFRKTGHNTKWNLLTLMLICGFLYTFYMSFFL